MLFTNKYISEEVNIEFSRYSNHSTAILLTSIADGSTIAKATTNVDGLGFYEVSMLQNEIETGDKYIAIKNYSENEGVDTFLIKEGIISEKPLFMIPLGLLDVPFHELTEKGLQMLHTQLGKRQPLTEEEIESEREELQKFIDSL